MPAMTGFVRGVLTGVGLAICAIDPTEAHAVGTGLAESVFGVTFVALPAGCFEMGDLEVGIVGRVCVKAFSIGTTELTNAAFKRFKPRHRSGSLEGQSLDGDDQPVVNVSWREATAYAIWLSERTGKKIRLPTEAEWEYAARAGTATAHHWGAGDEDAYHYANLRSRADDFRPPDPFAVTAPVGKLKPNAWGLHDMLGNVAEWVQDSFKLDKDRFGKNTQDPLVAGKEALKVRRGGSFDDPARIVRSGSRESYIADFGLPHTGFRLVMEP